MTLDTRPATAPIIASFAEIARDYDVILCDIWGVLHNGVAAYEAAGDALTRAREAGTTVVLVSNAPREAAGVERILDTFGVPRTAYDTIVTSGMVTTAMLADHPGAKIWHLGPGRDVGIFEGLDLALTSFEEADLIVCTGLFDDTVETPDHYADAMKAAKARDLPFICANPDIVVERGGDLIWCAGAIAESYAALGGDVVFCGKPHRPVYETALKVARDLRGQDTPLSRTLGIGDALRTDLAGALGMGFDGLFVAAGIHSGDLGLEHGGPVDARALARLLSDGPGMPRAVIKHLAW